MSAFDWYDPDWESVAADQLNDDELSDSIARACSGKGPGADREGL